MKLYYPLFILISVFSGYTQTDTVTVFMSRYEYHTTDNAFNKEMIKNIIRLYNSNSDKKLIYRFKSLSSFEALFEALFEAVKNAKSDYTCAISDITITDERKKVYDFSEGYFPVATSLVSLESKNTNKLDWKKSIKRVGCSPATIHYETAKTFCEANNLTLVDIDDNLDYGELIKKGVVDAYIGDSIVPWRDKERSIITYIKDAPITYFGIMYPKNSALKKMLDPKIKYFVKSRVYYELVRTYLNKDVNKYFRDINYNQD